MDVIGQLFWAVMILTALQPVITQRLLVAQRVRVLRALERRRRSRVITLVHRQESMGFLGFPLFRFIDIDDSELVLRAIRATPDDLPIDLVLHTPGGLVLAAEQIARALAAHPAPVRVLVPHYAMSGGTLIALAADEILMDAHAVLGPVDPQIGGRPAASIVAACEQKSVDELDDGTLVEADIAKKALAQVHATVVELLSGRHGQEGASHIASTLADGHFTHDHGLTLARLRELPLPVSDALPGECYDIMALYPQPLRRSRSVEALPPTSGPANR